MLEKHEPRSLPKRLNRAFRPTLARMNDDNGIGGTHPLRMNAAGDGVKVWASHRFPIDVRYSIGGLELQEEARVF